MWQGCPTTWPSKPAGTGCDWSWAAHGYLRGGRPAAPLPLPCLLARGLLTHGWDMYKTHPGVRGITNPHPRWQWGGEKEGKIPPGLGRPHSWAEGTPATAFLYGERRWDVASVKTGFSAQGAG